MLKIISLLIGIILGHAMFKSLEENRLKNNT